MDLLPSPRAVGSGARSRRARKLLVATLTAAMLAACSGGGALAPSSPGGHTATPVPVHDDWPMYAHDGRHTSASAASISGPLKVAWRYDPQAAAGDTFAQTYNAVATTSGVYVHWFQSNPKILGAGPSVDSISNGGQRTWTFVELRDYDEGHWLSIFNGSVVLDDDGEPLLNLASGTVVKTLLSSYDVWGELIPDSTGLYGTNTFLADGPDLFVYAVDTSNATRWKALQQTSPKYSTDNDGGLLLSNGVVFYAAAYGSPTPHASGLYALNSSTGAQIAYVATTPSSEMSADATNLYLFEGGNLVARSQSNLAKVWSAGANSSAMSAPVVANGLVIVQVFNGIEAHDANSGNVVWTSSVQPAQSGQYSTGMCAALGSGTLLVASFDGLHLLKLSTGKEIWHGAVAGANGSATNPIIVNDPTRGPTVYLTDYKGVIALVPG